MQQSISRKVELLLKAEWQKMAKGLPAKELYDAPTCTTRLPFLSERIARSLRTLEDRMRKHSLASTCMPLEVEAEYWRLVEVDPTY